MHPFANLVGFVSLLWSSASAYPTTVPMNCTDTSRLCTSFLAFKPDQNQTLAVLKSMFDVDPAGITVEDPTTLEYVFIRKNCSCLSTTKKYATNTTYTMKSEDGLLTDIVDGAYEGLAMVPNSTRRVRIGAVVSLRLYCGCSSGLWNYFMSYVLKDGDSVQSLASRFGVSMDSIETANGISNPDNVTVGDLYFIPLDSVPGVPYPLENASSPAPAPTVASPIESLPESPQGHKVHVPYGWIIGGIGVGLFVIILGVIAFFLVRSSCCANSKDDDGKVSHKFQILRNPSFLCGSGRYICCKKGDWKQTNGESSNNQINVPRVLGADVFDVEKPVVFLYEDILFSTDGFSDSSLLGHGTYGSVYYGVIHDQEVAKKKKVPTATLR